MALNVAVQMDPIETINIDGDSTFALMLAAQARGHALWHYEVRHMTLSEGVAAPGGKRHERLRALARPVRVKREHGRHYEFGEAALVDLGGMDVVLMRQDPPFDMAYITATHMLEHIHPRTLVVNDPAAVRNAPEKLLVTHFPDLMPPTLVTWDSAAIRDFRAQYKDIIVKPLFGNGGAGVFRIKPDDENLASLLEMHFARSREPLMVQRYESAVRAGDKRIVLVDGKPAGAVNRVPAAGEARSNMHVGGRPEKSPLTARDMEICEAIGPMLRDQGLIFVGIDVIGDYLTEINVTSPTGLQEIARFDGTDLSAMIWDVIEAKRGWQRASPRRVHPPQPLNGDTDMADMSQIKEHAEVIGADGVHVGTVDHVEGNRIKLTKRDSNDQHHHYITSDLIAEVEDGTVRLSANADVAVTMEQAS